MSDIPTVKKELLAHCETWISQKIALAKRAMDEAQQAANEETKSSAGDKFETGRAMMHLEREKYARQLARALELQSTLVQINVEKTYSTVQPGCLVETDHSHFFIAIGAGKIMLNETKYFAISQASPIGALLCNLEEGAEVDFRGRKIRILSVG